MKTISTILLCALSYTSAIAQTKADTNIVISSSRELYEFVYNKKTSSVEIKSEMKNTFLCNDYRDEQTITEYYNNQVSIDNIEISVDGRRNKTIVPKCDFYSVEGTYYSDMRLCYFMLPFVKKGTESEVEISKTTKDPRYFSNIFFREPVNVRHKEVVISIPRWMKVDIKEYHFEGYTISKKTEYDSHEDADIITYTMSNLPAQKHERSAPGPTYTEPHLLILSKSAETKEGKLTYFASLADQYKWYHSLVADLVDGDPSVKAKAVEVSTGSSDELDKIKAVYYWVQNNIRYIAFEDGIAGFKPEAASEVLRKKYGDCKGMANLTKSMLRSLGFDARLCWIGTNHIAYDYSTPALCVDNHMICGLNYKGQVYYLDATENYIGFGEYAERIQGRQVLMEDGANYKLLKVPSTTYDQNTDFEKRILSISGNDVTGTAEHTWKGEEKEDLLIQLNNIKKDKASDAFIKYLSNRNPDVQISDFKTSNLENFDKDITANYKFVHKNAVSAFGKEIYVDLDFRKEFNDFLFKKDERTSDYWFDSKSDLLRETVLNIPSGYTVTSVPGNLSLKNDNLEINVTFTQQPGKLLYKKNLIIKNSRLSKKEFEQWNSDIIKLQSVYNEQVVLTSK